MKILKDWIIFPRLRFVKKSKIKEILKENDKVQKGFAFVQPLTSYSYDLRVGRKVITSMGIGEITGVHRNIADVYLYDKKYDKPFHVNDLYIITVLDKKTNRLMQLSPHDLEYLFRKVDTSKMTVYIEYRKTRHGNVALTDTYKALFQ